MTELSLPIDHFKKAAKNLHKKLASTEPEACNRVRAVFTDLAGRSDRDVAENCSLMRVQHAIAKEHHFDSWNELINASAMELHLAITMARLPHLTVSGIGVVSDSDATLISIQAPERFQQARDTLRASSETIVQVVEWLRTNLVPTKNINPKYTSYGLMHCAEKDIGSIAHGVFIAAAIIAGYKYKVERGSSNVFFGINETSLKRWTKAQRTMRRSNRYIDGEEQRAALVNAGWTATVPGYWIAKPGTAPGGEWSTQTAFAYLHLGNAMRALAARGWDVPGEYVGEIGVGSWGPYVLHPAKAPRFIRISTALGLEGLPELHPHVSARFGRVIDG